MADMEGEDCPLTSLQPSPLSIGHNAPPEGEMCMICCDDISQENYVEFRDSVGAFALPLTTRPLRFATFNSSSAP